MLSPTATNYAYGPNTHTAVAEYTRVSEPTSAHVTLALVLAPSYANNVTDENARSAAVAMLALMEPYAHEELKSTLREGFTDLAKVASLPANLEALTISKKGNDQ